MPPEDPHASDETPQGAVPEAPVGPPAVLRFEPLTADPAPTAAPATRRPRAAVVVLSAALVLVLVVSGLVLARMFSTNQAWEDSSAGWEKLANDTANELAATKNDLATATSELEATSAQLATAQQRITELANEKAQLGDTSASQQQLADYQARVSLAAGQVATALASCVSGQQKLIGYLQDSAQYDAAQLTQFGQDVQTVCEHATDANTALQDELRR